jgi:hypothetical protein
MMLEVLIVTPSGPFGELIRLTLEADPEFHCSMLDNSGELRATLQDKPCQAVIYDCSFPQPVPGQVVAEVHDEFPETAILLIPADNRSESSIPADGWVTRPFDASSLTDAVKKAIMKKQHPDAVKFVPQEIERKPSSWWNAFQSGVRETTADSGLMVQNGLVIASTPNISTALQQQVTASVLRFWNPEDSSDLMRYVKDLVNGQEWMMYATKAADGAVLVLLYLPQTPVTRVRAQTLKLAKDVAGLMGKPSDGVHRSGLPENAEPPRLHEILNEKTGGSTGHVIKNGFPVDWFREADLPDFQAESKVSEEAAPGDEPVETMVDDLASSTPVEAVDFWEKPAATGETPEMEVAFPVSDLSAPKIEQTEDNSVEPNNTEDQTGETTAVADAISPEITEKPDLGKFQPVGLILENNTATGLDEMQPITLESIKPEQIPQEQAAILPEPSAESEVAVSGDEIAPQEPVFPPSALNVDDHPVVSRDEVEEALSILSSRLNMENSVDDESIEPEAEVLTPDAQKILSETDSTGIDVASFQAELSKLEFNDTWTMPDIITGSPLEPTTISESETEEMAAFLAGIEAQSPQLGQMDAMPQEMPLDLSLSVKLPDSVPPVEPEDLTPPVEISGSELPVVTAEAGNTIAPVEIPGMELPVEPSMVSDIQSSIPPAEVVEQPAAETELPEATSNDLFARMNQLESPDEPEGMETYTVALIPGTENLFIQRQYSNILNQTMNRLALAFNWTLVNLTIRPTYMQWTLSMPVTLPQEDMISIVRKETTAELKKANPEDLSGIGDDYWFPQTMSAAGKDFVPSIHWQDFILRRKTREIA